MYAIENGAFPEWDFGVQIIPEEDEHKFDFDLLDPTKLVPEEEVPVELVGTLTLNRNPDNFFAETEQIAFHPGHLVPESILLTTHYYKVGCFRIPTRSCQD